VKVNSIFELGGAFIFLAICTDILTSRNTATIVTSGGNAFSQITKSALGK
jgi:hypothetical protein